MSLVQAYYMSFCVCWLYRWPVQCV